MIRVMIVDDQRILLEGLLHLFEKTGKIEVVKILQLSEVAEVAAQVLQPDIILMDICMEGRTSAAALKSPDVSKRRFPGRKSSS